MLEIGRGTARQQLYAKDGKMLSHIRYTKMVRAILSLHYSKVSQKMQ